MTHANAYLRDGPADGKVMNLEHRQAAVRVMVETPEGVVTATYRRTQEVVAGERVFEYVKGVK